MLGYFFVCLQREPGSIVLWSVMVKLPTQSVILPGSLEDLGGDSLYGEMPVPGGVRNHKTHIRKYHDRG